MANVYETIESLLKDRKISGAKMSRDLNMSRSFMTELKKGRAKGIKAETADRIANYFGVTVDYLLTGEEKTATQQGGGDILDDVDFAFYGEFKELTEENKEILRDMVRIMRARQGE